MPPPPLSGPFKHSAAGSPVSKHTTVCLCCPSNVCISLIHVVSLPVGQCRQRSAAKEMLTILKPLLPEGTQIQTVKVGCRGLAVVRVSPAAAAAAVADSSPVPVTDIVAQVLDQIETGKLKHTK